jgi:hypothetical protein
MREQLCGYLGRALTDADVEGLDLVVATHHRSLSS